MKYSFSEKEKQIIREEMENSGAAQKNVPVLQQLFLSRPDLKKILFDPFRLLLLIDSTQRTLSTNASLTGTKPKEEDYLVPIMKQLAPHINGQLLIGYLLQYIKLTKIKKEKRALLWAVADLMVTVSDKINPEESPVVRSIVMTSIQNAMFLAFLVESVVEKQGPFNFDYTKFTEEKLDLAEYNRIYSLGAPSEPNLSMGVSVRAMEIFSFCQRPFGLRFYHLLHYPEIAGEVEKKRILLPGQSSSHESDDLSDEQLIRLSEALMKDIQYWNLSLQYRVALLKEVLVSVKSVAFAELENPVFQAALRALAYCILFTENWIPFFTHLYQTSGQNADHINPEDERDLIIDLKGSPLNPRAHRLYAELLYDKQELFGALNVYRRLSEILPEPDESVNNRIEEIIEKLAVKHN